MKTTIVDNLKNVLGWRTDRKLVVFESDDWGMIRMASTIAKQDFISKGYSINQCPYNSNDRLESNDDLQFLSEILLSVKDCAGKPAKFTINTIVANPDFEKIKNDNFENYYHKPFTETLKEYPGSQNVMTLYKEGIDRAIFQPQLHGREHVNLRLWMNRLQNNNPNAIEAFNHNMYTVHKEGAVNGRRDNLDAFGNANPKGDNYDFNQIIAQAQELFFDAWGFKSESFISPCYIWHPSLEKILQENGIKYIQGSNVQLVPVDDSTYKIRKKYHYMGQKNKFNQHYLVRNCLFEPTQSNNPQVVSQILKDIKLAFSHKKPAIIGTHRVNYIGSLNPKNRDNNLRLLQQLLNEIVKKWPDVEFISSDQLGKLIYNKKEKCVGLQVL